MRLFLLFLFLFPVSIFCQNKTALKKPIEQAIVKQEIKERDWVDIATGLGSVATVATLIFLFYLEYKTRKDVKDLTVVAETIGEQNRLLNAQLRKTFKPSVYCTRISNDDPDDISFNLHVNNERAYIMYIDYGKVNVEFYNEDLPPIELKIYNPRMFKCRLIGKAGSSDHLLTIKYADIIGNLYFSGIFLKNGTEFIYYYEEPSDMPNVLINYMSKLSAIKSKAFDEESRKRFEEFENEMKLKKTL